MRISTTAIESYRLFMQPEQEWMTEQSLIDSILGKFVPNQAVLIGSAFGHILETPDPFRVPGGYEYRAQFFSDATMAPALALMDRRAVYEAKATKRYGRCDVVAMADQLLGSQLIEHKTTLSTFDFDKYADSYQWRFMVDIFEPSVVTYHVFLLHEERDGSISLKGTETFNLYPYAGLHQDCCALLRDFVSFVELRGLAGYLRERQLAA